MNYFISLNVYSSEVQILDPIGKSDHMLIRFNVERAFEKFRLRRQRVVDFSGTRKNYLQVSENLIDIIKNAKGVKGLNALAESLGERYQPRARKYRDYFQLREEV